MVNQKLALSEGATPCSTIKLSVALAAQRRHRYPRYRGLLLGKTWKMDMTQALAHSNNAYFEALGRKMGFAKVSHYAHEYGLGEMAGYNIQGEHLGVYPSEELPGEAWRRRQNVLVRKRRFHDASAKSARWSPRWPTAARSITSSFCIRRIPISSLFPAEG